MIKLIKEDTNEDKPANIMNVYKIEVPVKIEGTDIEIPEDYIDINNYYELLKKYESYVNENLDIDDENYQILLDEDIEIIENIIISKDLLKFNSISIPKDLTEQEIKSIISNYLSSAYLSSYEELVINVTPTEFNELYSKEISNGEIEARLTKNNEPEKLSINVELVLELDKIRISK